MTAKDIREQISQLQEALKSAEALEHVKENRVSFTIAHKKDRNMFYLRFVRNGKQKDLFAGRSKEECMAFLWMIRNAIFDFRDLQNTNGFKGYADE
jgi:hypothetical protein